MKHCINQDIKRLYDFSETVTWQTVQYISNNEQEIIPIVKKFPGGNTVS